MQNLKFKGCKLCIIADNKEDLVQVFANLLPSGLSLGVKSFLVRLRMKLNFAPLRFLCLCVKLDFAPSRKDKRS